jgi:membrane protease YdiL (CAAX protease family)
VSEARVGLQTAGGSRRAVALSILSVLLAIAITTAMDANGLSAFSALPLAPLIALFWIVARSTRREMGLVPAPLRDFVPALLHPVIVVGIAVLAAVAAGAADRSRADWGRAARHAGLIALTTFVVVTVTEEGFFRGWLWASLSRAGVPPARVLVWTSVAFALWHVSAVSLPTGFDLPRARIPLFLVNVAVLGAVWGLLRWRSGSVLVASAAHGLWNGLDYVLFGYGTRTGALGVAKAEVFGPEVGVLGLTLNVLFLLALWRWVRGKLPSPAR